MIQPGKVLENCMKLLSIITRSFVACGFVRNMSIFLPPRVNTTNEINREKFSRTFNVPILEIADKTLIYSSLVKMLKKYVLKVQKFQAIQGSKIYLNPEIVQDFSHLPVEELKTAGIDETAFKKEDITLSYDNWKADQLIKAILPEGIEPVTSFSRVGHIIHLNLKDELLPYKSAIAQIFLDKTPNCRTVINKAQNIDNTFRNFQIDLLKGDDDFQVQVKENGIAFEFDFSSVYWNPRLNTEHERLVKLLKENDYLYDVFAGVGPFSVPAGRKKVNVLANDLNPYSFKWLEHNVRKNKCSQYVQTFNKDGREFILEDVRKALLERIKNRELDTVNYSIHIAMNLPALSVTFLDAFVGLLKENVQNVHDTNSIPIPVIHCYCFVKGVDDPKVMAKALVEEHIGFKLTHNETLKDVSFVRNVAPNKDMMRVDILLTSDILFGNVSSHKRSNDSQNDDDVNPSKKSCNDARLMFNADPLTKCTTFFPTGLSNGKEQE